MARYIDAERLKRTFASGIRVYDGMCKIADVMHNISNEPTADVEEVKHGEWKYECLECSTCKRNISEICDADSYLTSGIEGELLFCPFCGAKMDGGKAE